MLGIGRSLLQALSIEEIRPEPSDTSIDARGAYFTFAREERAGPIGVVIRMKPEERWLVRGTLWLDEGSSVDVLQFVYP